MAYGNLLICARDHAIIPPEQRPPVPVDAPSGQGNPVNNPRFKDFPALPAGVQSPVELPGEWFVARVQGQHEYRAVRMLHLAGIGYYIPLIRSRSKDPRNRVLKPLFPNNVFVCATAEMDAYAALKRTESFSTTIDVSDQGRLIRELSQIHLATESGFDLRPYPGIVKGARCEVVRGSMLGAEGEIIKIENEFRVVMSLTILGRKVETTIPIEWVEPL